MHFWYKYMHAYTQKVASIEPRWSMHDHSCCSACVGSTSPPSSKFSRIKSKLFSRIETNLQLHEQQAKDHTHTILDLHALRPRISPRFLTRPQLSPSGVSAGQSIPHWLGWSARGPDTFRSFWNCESTLVIMPRDEMKLSLERTCVAPRVGQGSVGNVSAAIQALPVGVARIATERWLYRFSAYRALVVLVPLQKQYLGTTLRPSSLSPNTCVAVLREVSKASARWYHWNYHGGGTNAAQSLEKHTKTPRVRRWRKHIRCTNVASAIPLLCFFPIYPVLV